MNTDKIYAQQIANEYTPKDTSKIVKLRKLDKKAKQGANIFAYSFGLLSALVFGGRNVSFNENHWKRQYGFNRTRNYNRNNRICIGICQLPYLQKTS